MVAAKVRVSGLVGGGGKGGTEGARAGDPAGARAAQSHAPGGEDRQRCRAGARAGHCHGLLRLTEKGAHEFGGRQCQKLGE